MTDMVRFGASLPAPLIKAFDESIRRKGYATRSEAIRDLMRQHLVDQEWEKASGEVIATVTIVYDHETRELSRVLNSLQHQFHEAIVCSTHVHVDAHHCLEVIIIKGRSEEVRAIADRLISTKGVKHGRLVSTTTGQGLA
jgi:CopG family nickel-responsive transcriptional regulator